MLYMFGPEFTLILTLGQWYSARASVRQIRQSGHTNCLMKNAFFADVGSFVLKPANWKAFPLNAKQVHYLVSHEYVDHQYVTISVKDIEEKKKKEGFARFITVLRTLWFVLNCIGRVA